MRNKILTLLLLLLATPAFGLLGVTGKVELDSNSKFVYRGVEHQDKFVLQPNASVSAFGLRGALFNNVTLNPDGSAEKLDETHVSLRYDIGAMGFNITPGVKYYRNWNEGMNDTTEVSLGFSYTLLGMVGIYSTHYIDVVEDFGKYYGNVGAAFKFDILPLIGAEGYMDLNWQKPYFGDSSDFTFPYSLNVGAAVKFKPMPFVYIKAHADATIVLDGDTKDMIDAMGRDSNILYFGLAVGLQL